VIADLPGDGLDGLLGRCEQLGGAPHAQVRDLVHWTSAELAATQPAEVFSTVAGFAGQSRQGPILGQVSGETFPQQPKAVIVFQGLGKPEHIRVNQLNPMVNHRWLRRLAAFVQEAKNRRMKRQHFKGSHHRRGRVGDRSLFGRLLIADPTKLPPPTRHGFKCIQCVCRQQAGMARAANAPTPIDEHLALAAKAVQKVSRGLPAPNNPRGRYRLHDPHVDDLVVVQRRALGKIGEPRSELDVQRFHTTHPRARAVNRNVGEFLIHSLSPPARFRIQFRTPAAATRPLTELQPIFGRNMNWSRVNARVQTAIRNCNSQSRSFGTAILTSAHWDHEPARKIHSAAAAAHSTT